MGLPQGPPGAELLEELLEASRRPLGGLLEASSSSGGGATPGPSRPWGKEAS
eukprot:NODE_3806_length_879_cov_15.456627_g3162_i0.p4 GENE.NODE_3806_length_879_cov_15.456627_g3162_i0~~NODE_3806_length_879_cov_15.456627_g3162_i0.p4  ORF type:complete len:52 (-),score=0.27 NODE_3806_length_879_cov_15.456627_g3162_i0:364-519(-)